MDNSKMWIILSFSVRFLRHSEGFIFLSRVSKNETYQIQEYGHMQTELSGFVFASDCFFCLVFAAGLIFELSALL